MIMMKYNYFRAMSRVIGLLLFLLVTTHASEATGQRSNDSVSRLLRGLEQAKDLPAPSEALPAARRQRRRLAIFGGVGLSSNSTVKHDLRAFWQHLGKGFPTDPQSGINENDFEDIGTTDMGNTYKSDLEYVKTKLKYKRKFKGCLTRLVEEIDEICGKLDIPTQRRRLICKYKWKSGQQRQDGSNAWYAGSASTKTLKNYVRAIHMFLFKNMPLDENRKRKRFGNIGRTQEDTKNKYWNPLSTGDDFKNLTKLDFSFARGEGVLTYMMRKLTAINSDIQKKMDEGRFEGPGKDDQIAELQRQLQEKDDRIGTLEEENQEIEGLRDTIASLEPEIERLKMENDSQQDWQRKFDDQQKEIQDKQVTIEERDSQIEKLRSENQQEIGTGSQQTITELKEENSAHETKIHALETEIKDQKQKTENHESDYNRLDDDFKALQQQIEEWNNRINTHQRENTILKEKNAKQKKQNKKLKGKLAKYETDESDDEKKEKKKSLEEKYPVEEGDSGMTTSDNPHADDSKAFLDSPENPSSSESSESG